jgi:MinD-like ATPase involved in chromosome partitioning or flagellar assembly/CheY-like chemotaxis protein
MNDGWLRLFHSLKGVIMDTITILIIDADEANRNFLAQLLTKKNYQIRQASSGQEGIRIANTEKLSMVIFDTKLPDMQAVDFLERVQLNPGFADIPCVVLSSRSDPDEMRMCLDAGCAEYFVKSGMVMMTLVDSVPKLLVEGRRLSKKKGHGYLFVFLSGKGGTGTSSLCANIGMNMANHLQQSHVAVADLVLPMGSVASVVGADEDAFNLVTVAGQSEGMVTKEYFKSNLLMPPHWGFHLLPGAPTPESSLNLQAGNIPNIIKSLRGAYDYVLADLGRSLSRISLPVIQEADLIVLVLGTDLSTVNHTKKLWHYLQGQGISPKQVYPILNRAVGLEGLTKAEAEKILGLEIKLMMPYMMGNFTLANNQHIPISAKFPTDTASIVLKQAAVDMSQMVVKMEK